MGLIMSVPVECLNPPIPVMSGDLLAVSQPSPAFSIVRVHYIDNVQRVRFSSSQHAFGTRSGVNLNNSLITNQLILVYPVTDNYCVNSINSITPSIVREYGFKVHQSQMFSSRRQYLYPDMLFSCNGSVTKWIFGAVDQKNNQDVLVEFQIWHKQGHGSNIYSKVSSSSMSLNNITMIGTNLYQYTPQTPLQFRKGDVFGAYIPDTSLSPFVFYEQRQSGPTNVFVYSDNALSVIAEESLDLNANNFPLVAAEIRVSTNAISNSIISSTTINSMHPVLRTTSISTAIVASSKASATPVISVTPISKSSATTIGESSVTTSYKSNVTVFVTTTATPLSPTSQSTVSALIIGMIAVIVCTVFIVISLIIVTCICLKRKLPANIRSSAIVSPIPNTTKYGNSDNNSSFPKENNDIIKNGDSSIIAINDPVYESMIYNMAYEPNIITTKNAAYQCSVPQISNIKEVNDEDI
ncbi:PREDICTED: uncharacterized protein LOC109582303 isoform X2 [Amphimedon queenslandica]|uniref:Uncharacterized protein n=1 Tax=Amphimedon queenslandica TaxID=400682 RepID=A0AAN0J686_AMPQE|nr:PREDICTED: uncharacterized protein LOC109582303 isoform X2 [Amphimedon queenslandica]|eukprot:XP_019852539.1 PREDICTED: uncharacterized protein LOC109582303 isoform X2 [Amphimedon queenslandica]